MHRFPAVYLATCCLLPAMTLSAQPLLPVQVGQRVRIRTECTKFDTDTSVGLGRKCPTYVGAFLAADARGISLTNEQSSAETTVMLDAVEHFYIYRGRRAFGIGKGAGLGAVVGGVAGAWIAESSWGVPIGAVVGGFAAGLIRYESWEEVSLDDLAAQPLATSRRHGLGLTLRF